MGYRVYVEMKKENREFGQPIGVFELDTDLIILKTNQREVMSGQVYTDNATLKEVMRHYAISERIRFRVDRSNAISYALICMSEDCEWRFKTSSINKSELFKVREFNDKHTCPLKDKVYEQRQAGSSLIGDMIRSKLTNHKRKYTPKDIIDDMKSDFSVDIEIHIYNMYAIVFVGHMLSLAYGVIDSENDASWSWFFEKFKEAYGERENMCIVSIGMRKFKKSHSKLREIYFSMVKAYTQTEFDSLMEMVEKAGAGFKKALQGKSQAGLALSKIYKAKARLGLALNKLCKAKDSYCISLHSSIKMSSSLIFCQITYRMYSIVFNVVPSTEYLHTVNDEGRHYPLCLLERKCSCGQFQVDELPCLHDWAILKSKFVMPEDYCSDYYKQKSVLMTYEVPVYPMPYRNEWKVPAHISEEAVLPPKWKRPPGRPKKKRDKPLSELLQKKNQHSYSICGHGGHNKRTCRNAPRRT
ncbi:uncharacterized protein LOC142163542 [Nicotiana tabacum]|uniref:Uncharacterized protein LOC142163542 n=1 Tax=Nicotiana tabacum TaxID=4097 RepID=A0AC58RW36_TOBAC